MILKHTAKIESRTHGTFGHEYGSVVSIQGYPISNFIRALSDLGLIVENTISEKTVDYKVGDKLQSAILPLNSRSIPKGRVGSYRLRCGTKTELDLRNISQISSSDGTEGGQCSTYGGIICDLTISGDYPHELTQRDLNIGGGLLEAMRDVYVNGKFSSKKKK